MVRRYWTRFSRPFLYENINSIEDLNAHKDELENKIVGIEPGSSLMNLTNKAMKEYDIKLKLVQSSEVAMMSELKKAYTKKKPIAVTLWNPHWGFSEFDLKYLKDPKKVYGEKMTFITLFVKVSKKTIRIS